METISRSGWQKADEENKDNYLNRRGYRDILTHSQAAIKSSGTSSKLVWNFVERLYTLACLNKVKLVWVPGHARINGNKETGTL